MPETSIPSVHATDSPLETRMGLFSGADFRLTTGRDADCAAIPQASWYFADEIIAVPGAGVPVAGFARGVTACEDIRQWSAVHAPGAPIDAPAPLWMAAPEVVRGAKLSADGATLVAGAKRWTFALVPRIPLNRSYYDTTSIAYLAQRTLTVRGNSHDGVFTARTIWPEEYRIDGNAPSQRVDASAEAIRALIRAEPRGGAHSAFAAVTLWERTPGASRRWEDAPVLAAVLNGAQGDDDEAHGGHFALITGRVGSAGTPGGSGSISDWMTNNFYTLDTESEKGIIAAMLPLDNYLADLNSGQAWYRPSYILVAILKRDRVASQLQGALARIYNQFYRHQLIYDHARMNCASISVDVLRALGWRIAGRGPTSRLVASLGLPYFALRQKSFEKAVQYFEYLTEDRTRLLPAAAFEEIGADLLRLAQGRLARTRTAFESAIAEDVEAVMFLRVPQFPSSRAWGDYPVVTAWEYARRMPSDPALQKIIPVPPRPFPDALRDPDLLPERPSRGEIALMVWAALSVIGIPWLAWRWWNGRRSRMREASGPG
jgi:hypothetical protein